MATVSYLPPSGDSDRTFPPPKVRRRQPLSGSALQSAAIFLCGTTVSIRVDLVGEIFLLELLLFLLALQCMLARGLGKGFAAPVFFGFIAAGMATLCGYLISDLVAANQSWQYLKGWGRVAFLIIDCAALMILAAQSARYLWWLVLGMGLGGMTALALQGLPFDTWKLGYGEYCALAVVAVAGLIPRALGVLAVIALGVTSLILDYRSLGAASLLAAGLLGFQMLGFQPERNLLRRSLAVAISAALAIGLLLAALSATDDQYDERRQLSNSGRYVGLVVAWRAITESPFIGYGSWAAEERFTRMLREEARPFEARLNRPMDVGRSLLPHSQFLQSWVEGGLLGTTFFLVYAWGLIAALRWFVLYRANDRLQPAGVYVLVLGLWNLLASPFLGFTRIFIAIAVAIIAIAYHERATAAAASRGRRHPKLQAAPVPHGAVGGLADNHRL